MKYAWIETQRRDYPLPALCTTLAVSGSGYRAWQRGGKPNRQRLTDPATDATHITRPSVDGQAAAMRRALESAALRPDAVGYINAHGTATLANDVVETAAIRQVFGAHAYRVPVSSTKSMHGHLLGAAGALEFVAAVLALERRIIPPTINLQMPDPECDLDYVPGNARIDVDLTAVMSNSFAFGGTNAVLICRTVTG